MTLTLTISELAYIKVRSALAIRVVSGNAYGALDDFVIAIVKAIEAGKATLELKTREEREHDAKHS